MLGAHIFYDCTAGEYEQRRALRDDLAIELAELSDTVRQMAYDDAAKAEELRRELHDCSKDDRCDALALPRVERVGNRRVARRHPSNRVWSVNIMGETIKIGDRPIEPGDVVRLKSGGLHKVVVDVTDGIATCEREVERYNPFSGGKYAATETEKHPTVALERVK